MRHLKKLRRALFAVVALGAVACGDSLLEIESQQNVSNDAYFERIGDFRAAVVGAYDQMQLSDWYGRSLHLMSDIMGEDVKQAGSANRYQEFADFEGLAVSGHDYETELWAEIYEGINMVNMMINADYEPPAAVQAEYNQLIGEAHAIRALAYFDLVKMYAQHYTYTPDASHPGVPLVLAPDINNLPARNTVAEVYNQIIDDFNTAVDLMTESRSGPYAFSDAAALGLLSRVYLYMGEWQQAVDAASAVINSGTYALATGDAYVNQFAIGGSSEAIFELEYNDTDNPGSDCFGCMYRASGYGDYLPAKDLLNLIDPEDIRIEMFVEDPDLAGIYASMRVNKYPTATQTDNVPVIRLSEVYLNRAEAYARLGQFQQAQQDLNRVRQRGLATAPDVTATGQALIDEILLERRIELGYEGHRIHDLMRLKQDVVREDCTGDVCTMPYPCDFCILPIPFEELDANPNITQNEGYPVA